MIFPIARFNSNIMTAIKTNFWNKFSLLMQSRKKTINCQNNVKDGCFLTTLNCKTEKKKKLKLKIFQVKDLQRRRELTHMI